MDGFLTLFKHDNMDGWILTFKHYNRDGWMDGCMDVWMDFNFIKRQ